MTGEWLPATSEEGPFAGLPTTLGRAGRRLTFANGRRAPADPMTAPLRAGNETAVDVDRGLMSSDDWRNGSDGRRHGRRRVLRARSSWAEAGTSGECALRSKPMLLFGRTGGGILSRSRAEVKLSREAGARVYGFLRGILDGERTGDGASGQAGPAEAG